MPYLRCRGATQDTPTLILIPVRVGIPSTHGTLRRGSHSSFLRSHPYLVPRGTRMLASPSTCYLGHTDPLSGTQNPGSFTADRPRRGDQHPGGEPEATPRPAPEWAAATGGLMLDPCRAGAKATKLRLLLGLRLRTLHFILCKIGGIDPFCPGKLADPGKSCRLVRVMLGCRKVSDWG